VKFPKIAMPWSRSGERAAGDPMLSVDQWLSFLTFGGLQYPFIPTQTLQGSKEDIPNSFAGYVTGAYKSNGIVFACMLARLLLFSEARFQFRRLTDGRPGDLFGNKDLYILEKPWSGATTGDLLTRAIQDADLAGNFYGARRNGNIKRLRPDWVTIVMASKSAPDQEAFIGGDIDAEVIGYAFHPGGPASGRPPQILLPEEVCHFAPIPDPTATYRGMSWITPVLREIMGDSAATTHKMKFFENGATVNMVISLDPSIQKDKFESWIRVFEDQHKGVLNAYKTLYLGGGASVNPVGANFQQMDFKVTQGAGETRIAAAAGVPPIIVGLSEGLQAATYSNYGQARRRFADGTMRPLWRNFAGSMQRIITTPGNAELWYDDRDIPFLRDDETDRAAIQQQEAQTIRTLVDAGFKPESVVDAVTNHDYGRLVHTGLFSVQLQPPGTVAAPAALPAPNGKNLPAVPSAKGM
jgi:hypothetical protein